MKDVKIEKGYAYILSLYRQEIIPKIQEGIMGLIRINSEYENLITPMSKEEYKGLKKSIEEDGIRTELHILPNGDILCGNKRYRISQELDMEEKDIPYKIVKIKGDTKIKQYIIEDNLLRKQLSTEQKAILEYQLYKLIKKPKKKGANGKFLPNGGDVYQKIADGTGQSRKTIVNHVKYAKFMEEHPTRKEKRLSRVLSQVKREEDINKQKEKAKEYKPSEDIKVYQGDFVKVCEEKIEDNSIDLILTDPLYLKDYWDLWDSLGKVAKRVLKPGGFLVAYAYQPHLNEYIERLSKSLDYHWCICLILKKGRTRLYSRYNFMLGWKPVLIFQKPPFNSKRVFQTKEDIFQEIKADKSLDRLQQTEESCKYLLEKFSKVGDLVLEPFGGSGTTLKVCKDMKRKCIGIEIDKEKVEIIKGRLNE